MSNPPPPPRLPQAGLDRLYTLWTVSALLTILLIVVLALLGSSRLQRSDRSLADLRTQIEALHRNLTILQHELDELKTDLAQQTNQSLPPIAAAETSAAPPPPEELDLVSPPPVAVKPAPTDIPETTLSALLAAAIRSDEIEDYQLEDHAAAEQALQAALAPGEKVGFNGDIWARLALAAELLDRPDRADAFAAQASKANRFPAELYELRTRNLLRRGEINAAGVYAKRLLARQPANAVAILLMSEVYSRNYEYTEAIKTLGTLPDHNRLPLEGELRLGRMLVRLEDSARLTEVLHSITNVPETFRSRVNFLRAVSAIHERRYPEALAILDQLLDETPADYDVRTWRGVVLLSARQFQAAREALAFADDYPNRPEALYWRGMLEIKDAQPEQARAFLEKSLTASPRFAPAWEALGMLEMNRGDLPAASLNLEKARAANAYRSSTHFLIALLQAKQLHPRETADALRAAFRLDPTLVEQATQTEAFLNLYSLEQIRAMAPNPNRTPPNTP